jgi:riboflavin kinase / FMN adenylyltransferase
MSFRRISHISELSLLGQPLHVALGVFDGVHLGHQQVIRRTIDAARQQGGLAGVVTFEPHPIRVLAPERAPRSLLASLDHKAQILNSLGLDFLLTVEFDLPRAGQEAEAFLAELCAHPIRTIAVGEDWCFGRGRRGNVHLLRDQVGHYGYDLQAVPPIMHEGERISSTRIRQAIRDGSLAAAAAMLGRPFTVAGTVTQGKQLGRTIGFPTANLEIGSEQIPPHGVWAVRARVGERIFPGVANLGLRPTVEDSMQPRLEVHLFGEPGDLYGAFMEVEFVEFLRGEEKFGSLEALKEQIGRDAARAKYIHFNERRG